MTPMVMMVYGIVQVGFESRGGEGGLRGGGIEGHYVAFFIPMILMVMMLHGMT